MMYKGEPNMIIAKSCGKDYLTEMKLDAEGFHAVYADQGTDIGGAGIDMRPGQLVLSGYAACMNIMIRRWMNEEGLAFRNVTVMVDMDNSTPGVSKFYKKIEIDADIPQEKKDELIKRADSCPVCNILNNVKEFHNMD